jgi:hypothetical protein
MNPLLRSGTFAARDRGQATAAFLALGVALALGLVLASWIVATEAADHGSYDTSTVEKRVKVVVTVEYAVSRKR